MGWFLAVVGFVVQLLCCIHGKTGMHKRLPLLIMAAVAAVTLVIGFTSRFFGFAGGMWLFWGELKILFAMVLAWTIYKLVLFTK